MGGVGLGRKAFRPACLSGRVEHLTHKRQGSGNCLPVRVSQNSQEMTQVWVDRGDGGGIHWDPPRAHSRPLLVRGWKFAIN
jgi:hypothetical protein